jgi:NAD-dependent dihydropyrimidine dehydrogenase PreA subunit
MSMPDTPRGKSSSPWCPTAEPDNAPHPTMMNSRARRASRRQTQFVGLDTHRCNACWKCIEACPQGVIGKVNVLIHKHAVLRNPELCNGCQKCVKTCEPGALSRLAGSSN